MVVEGNLEIIAASGRRLATRTKAFMCRCGASANKPYCDGSHKKIGFEAD
ncbi:MAG: CDGSH iron-sulfur domain-containing protein [Gammaproteobacteria bacterium]|nr:CDGSH iron-sulfur domain-containing protein [Gammaproteobacteria bacterium]